MFSNHVNINILGSTVCEVDPTVSETNTTPEGISADANTQIFEENGIHPMSGDGEENTQLINYKNQQIL